MEHYVTDKKLFCKKHSRILIGKSKCVDCEKEKLLLIKKGKKNFENFIKSLRKSHETTSTKKKKVSA